MHMNFGRVTPQLIKKSILPLARPLRLVSNFTISTTSLTASEKPTSCPLRGEGDLPIGVGERPLIRDGVGDLPRPGERDLDRL